MKMSKFTDGQIAYAPRLSEYCTPVVDLCRQLGICDAAFYVWKKNHKVRGAQRGRDEAAAPTDRGECAPQAHRR